MHAVSQKKKGNACAKRATADCFINQHLKQETLRQTGLDTKTHPRGKKTEKLTKAPNQKPQIDVNVHQPVEQQHLNQNLVVTSCAPTKSVARSTFLFLSSPQRTTNVPNPDTNKRSYHRQTHFRDKAYSHIKCSYRAH